MKRKLFLLLCALLTMIGVQAQEDVTSTYITNASFESDGAITTSGAALAITGWTQSNPGSSYNNTGCYDATTSIPTQGTVTVTPSDGDYLLFFRHGWNSSGAGYTFTSSSTTLPAGAYTLSVDYKMVEGYDNTQNNKTTVTIAAVSGENSLGSATGTTRINVSGGNDYTYLNTADWSTATANFTLEEATENVQFVITLFAGGQRRSDFVIDNVKLLCSPFISPTAIALSETALSLKMTEKKELTVTYTPANANTNTEITWTSSDETVATVEGGVVTAVGIGSATITATTANSVSNTCDVTVSDVTPAAAPSFYSEIAAGDFYLVNAGTGKPLGTIKDGWGTQAGLAEHGIPFTVAIGSGTYTLDSHTYNKATEHFFNGAYVDGASTDLYIAPLGNGKYSISTADGSAFVTANVNDNVVANTAASASSVLAQWYFVSKANYVSALAGATEANPIDATFYIQDPDFSRNHILQLLQNGQTTKNPGGETYLWKYTASNYHFKGGVNGNMCAETYQNGGGKIYQELTGIKNGKYQVKCQGFLSGSGATTLYANNESVGVAVFNAQGEETAASMSGASASFSAGYYQNELEVIVTDGNLTIGIENSSTNWACFDNFELYYLGPTIGGEAESLPETAMAAGKWYYFDIPVDGTYNLNTTTLSDIVYTQNGNILIENEGDVTATFPKAAGLELTTGRYYVKSSSAQVLRVIAGAYVYNVGAASLSSADGSYTQSQTFTVTFPDAASNDPDAVAAFVADSKATVNGAEVALTAVSGGFSLEISALAANSNYVITIPAGVYGYAGESMNEAINVTLRTPAIFDGEYVLYDATNKVFMGRGCAWGTEASADKYGIPFNLTTNAAGVSAFEFVDWTGVYLFSTAAGAAAGMYTDNANTGWNIIAVDGGYKVKDVAGDFYAKSDLGGYGYYLHTVAGAENATVWTVKTTAERDAIIAAYPTDNINNVIAASGISTTADAFETYLSENYKAVDVTSSIGTATFAGAVGDWTWNQVRGQDNQPAYGAGFAELWNATGAYTQTVAAAKLPAGIYKLTVQGYERRKDNNGATALKDAGYNLVSTFLSANGEQVRFTDWNDVDGKPTNTDAAVAAFTNGEAVNEVYVYLDGATNLDITVKKPNYIWDCWVIFNNFTLTYYKNVAANLKVSNGKLGTFIAPFNITLPAKVKAYSATVENNEVKLSKIDNDEIEAGTPIIVYGDGADVDETYYGAPTVEENRTVGNLVGILNESTKEVPAGAYVLQTQTGGQAFYKVATAAPGALNRCYLTTSEPNSDARLTIIFDGEDPTAINAIEAADAEDGALKDGKYLIDGKIVIVKNGVKYSANGQILK